MHPPQGQARLEPLISAAEVRRRIEELGRQITEDYPQRSAQDPAQRPLHLIGVLKGSFIFLSELARAIRREVSIDFVGTSSYGSSAESSGEIRLTKDIDEDIAGRDVILVEDIVDTGITVYWLCDLLRARGPRSLRIATLLDKPSRRLKIVDLHYVGFEIPDRFVVGYGLDYAQLYRNLPEICVLNNPDPKIES